MSLKSIRAGLTNTLVYKPQKASVLAWPLLLSISHKSIRAGLTTILVYRPQKALVLAATLEFKQNQILKSVKSGGSVGEEVAKIPKKCRKCRKVLLSTSNHDKLSADQTIPFQVPETQT